MFGIHHANIYKSGLLYYVAVGRRPDGGSHGWQARIAMSGTPSLAKRISANGRAWRWAGIQCSVCPQLLPNIVTKDEDKTKS